MKLVYKNFLYEAIDIQEFRKILADKYNVEIMLYQSKNYLVLDKIVVPKSDRSNGIGSSVLTDIINYADENNLIIYLMLGDKNDGLGTTSRNRLIKFYKRFGFLLNKGKNIDYSISYSMYRKPKSAKLEADLEDEDDYDSDVDADEDETDEDEDESNDYPDGYGINKLKRDNEHEYETLQGVTYRMSYTGKDTIIDIGKIEETLENTFYPNQIKKYIDYIREGGIIDTFPVSVSPLAYSLEEMLDFIDENYYDTPWSDTVDDEILTPSPFWNDIAPSCMNIYLYTDEDEEYFKYTRINRKARTLNEVFPLEDRTPDELALLEELKIVFKFFEENKEYTLTDMNHRFQAVKELGVTAVWVELV